MIEVINRKDTASFKGGQQIEILGRLSRKGIVENYFVNLTTCKTIAMLQPKYFTASFKYGRDIMVLYYNNNQIAIVTGFWHDGVVQ